jgi:hypothetical protein
MIKVQILTTCQHCDGEAYLPIGEAVSFTGEAYTRYEPCPVCQGSGEQTKWVSLREFADLLERAIAMEPDYQELAHHIPATTVNQVLGAEYCMKNILIFRRTLTDMCLGNWYFGIRRSTVRIDKSIRYNALNGEVFPNKTVRAGAENTYTNLTQPTEWTADWAGINYTKPIHSRPVGIPPGRFCLVEPDSRLRCPHKERNHVDWNPGNDCLSRPSSPRPRQNFKRNRPFERRWRLFLC